MSPSLDYKTSVPVLGPKNVSITELFTGKPAPLFYDGTPGRETVPCPDCRKRADALFGDHGGDCVPGSVVHAAARPTDALTIIRRAAGERPRLSINDLRAAFDKAAIRETSRGPAFAQAVRREWLEPDGSVPSTDPATKGHRVQTYRSLLFREAVA